MLDEEEIGKIKIFRAPMGVGKTYSVFTKMVPELMLQKGVKAFWYFAPNTENINLIEIAEYTTKLWKKSNEYKSLDTPMIFQIGGEYGNNYKLAQTYLNLNRPVILCSTDSSISNTLLNKNDFDSEIDIGEFDLLQDVFGDSYLRFTPKDSIFTDYDLKYRKSIFNSSTAGIGTQTVGFIDLTGAAVGVASTTNVAGITSSIIGVGTHKFNSLFVKSNSKLFN